MKSILKIFGAGLLAFAITGCSHLKSNFVGFHEKNPEKNISFNIKGAGLSENGKVSNNMAVFKSKHIKKATNDLKQQIKTKLESDSFSISDNQRYTLNVYAYFYYSMIMSKLEEATYKVELIDTKSQKVVAWQSNRFKPGMLTSQESTLNEMSDEITNYIKGVYKK